MIKKLRVKFICVAMAVFAVMLLVIFGLVFHFTRASLEKQSIMALQAFSVEPLRPGDLDQTHPNRDPVFALTVTENGTMLVAGSAYYDLTDQQLLRAIIGAAQKDGRQTGELRQWALRYLRTKVPEGIRYTFVDISGHSRTMQSLLLIFVSVTILAGGGALILSILLSKWMVRPVEQAWEQQRQFVADASHELKTPLTVILTNAELLRSPDYDAEAKDRFSQSIHAMSCQMRGLVEKLLELARVDNSKSVKMEAVDFSALAEEAVLPFEAVYFEAGRALHSQVQMGLQVSGDPEQLRQVLEILLDNGCKYGAPGQPVELRLEKSGHSCLLQVISRGETLSPQQCRDIFQRFYRVDQARSMNRSYGLGLSIAQRIIQEHRGKIWAQGREGVNTFFVSLPLK